MASKTQTFSSFDKLQKRITKLLKMRRNGSVHSISYYKQRALIKRYDRYLNKVIKADHSISKAFGLATVAMLFSMESQAQVQCNQFVNADKDNPFKSLKLPFQITKPVFVDIDHDGDLDCYVTYPDSSYNVKFAFLRNTGTKDLPLFKLDSTGGFPQSTTIPFDTQVEGMVFADIDGDGDYDCFIGYYGGNTDNYIVYFENVGTKTNPSFVQSAWSANPLNFVGGAYGLYFSLVDIDADGDYDLYTYDLYYNNFWRNTGTKTNPQFVLVSHEEKFFNYQNAHAIFTDWNKDGLIDNIKCHVVSLSGTFNNPFYINDGTLQNPHFTKDATDGPVIPRSFNLYLLADLNNDGFPEAFSYTGGMESTAPVATITGTQTGQGITLQAYPKGNYTYQWKRNRVTIPNETKDSLHVSESGKYVVEITGNCGTGISLPYNVTIGANVITALPGEEDASAITTEQVHLYPNPFTNECILKFDKGLAGKTIIHITDAQGRLVTSLNTTGDALQFGKELKPGIYFVQVIQNNKIAFIQKLIKQ